MDGEEGVEAALGELLRLQHLWYKESQLAMPVIGLAEVIFEQEVFRPLTAREQSLAGIVARSEYVEGELARLRGTVRRGWILLGVEYEGWIGSLRSRREAAGAYEGRPVMVELLARSKWDECRVDLGQWRDEVAVARAIGLGADEATELRKYDEWLEALTTQGDEGGARVLSLEGAIALLGRVTEARVGLREQIVQVLRHLG